MPNWCTNRIRILVAPDRTDALIGTLAGPDVHWAEIEHITGRPTETAPSAHEQIRLRAEGSEFRKRFREAGRPDWMPFSNSDLAWYLEHRGDLSSHPCVKQVPFSLAKLAPWAGPEEYRAWAGRYMEFYIERFGVKWTPDFYAETFDRFTANDGRAMLDLDCNTPWGPPQNPLGLARKTLVAHGAEAIWYYYEEGNCFAGAQVFQSGEISDYYWGNDEFPTTPDEMDPEYEMFDSEEIANRLSDAGVTDLLAEVAG